jgi:hypothetical protein
VRALFTGRDLDGWEHVGDGGFELAPGAGGTAGVDDRYSVLRTHGGMGLLWYARESFGDCRLRVVYRTRRPEDNSGVFVRIDGAPPDAWHAVHHGYEVQILAAGDDWRRSGAVYTMSRALAHADRMPGEWNEMEIGLDGERIRVELNGVRVTDFDPGLPIERPREEGEPERGPRPLRGYIGLQNHDRESVVEFREVRVGPLDPA